MIKHILNELYFKGFNHQINFVFAKNRIHFDSMEQGVTCFQFKVFLTGLRSAFPLRVEAFTNCDDNDFACCACIAALDALGELF